MTPESTPEMRVRRGRSVNVKTPVWLDARANTRIGSIKTRYAMMLGRSVSTSIVVRRAVALLAAHLGAVGCEEAVARELAALAFHVR